LKNGNILVMGDINVDLIINGLSHIPLMGQEVFVDKIEFHTGGSATNVAVSLTKLGVSTALHAFLGNDLFGRQIREQLSEIGLNQQLIRTVDDTGTGISVAISNQADRAFISDMGSNKHYDPLELPEEKYAEFSHVHLSLYKIDLTGPYKEVVDRAHNAGCTVSMDLGWTEFGDKKNDLLRLLERIDIFFPNINEARSLCGDHPVRELAQTLNGIVQGIVIVKMGEEGACCYCQDEFCESCFKVNAIDSVGAGDAFVAGFLREYTRGSAISDCLTCGCACGAIAVTSKGGGDAGPTEEELAAFLKTYQ